MPPSDYIKGAWIPIPGDAIRSENPANPESILWHGSPCVDHVDAAVAAARDALPAWARLTLEERSVYLRRWQDVTARHKQRIADLICDESGKVMSESLFEAGALGGKVDITLDPAGSIGRVLPFEVKINETRAGHARFKPHGVMAVVGPFNFPAHLPNGHFIPALAMGNTIVFKPSEKTPAVGQLLTEMWDEVGLPPGVFNLVQGAADVSTRLTKHHEIDGILFTGSWPVGRKILEANLDNPGRIVALEMGGNNPAVIMPSANLRQAIIECTRAGFATTGQRCTCTRRVIVHESIADRVVRAMTHATESITIGPGRQADPAPFCGPLINEQSVANVIRFQAELSARGGKVVVESHRPDSLASTGGHFITPGLVKVDQFALEHDCEVFGPLVQIATCTDLDDAIEQANATQYGLAASLFSTDANEQDDFFHRTRSGCINFNTGTAGASSKLPFGGLGWSGNHRPAGAFSADYCAYPIASMVEMSDGAAVPNGMTVNDEWLSD